MLSACSRCAHCRNLLSNTIRPRSDRSWCAQQRMAAAISCIFGFRGSTWQHLWPRMRRVCSSRSLILDDFTPSDLQANPSPSPHYRRPLHFASLITRVTSAHLRLSWAGVVPVARPISCSALPYQERRPLSAPASALQRFSCLSAQLPNTIPLLPGITSTVLQRPTEHQSYLSDILLNIGQSTERLFLQPGSRTLSSRMTYRTSEEHLVPRYYFLHVYINAHLVLVAKLYLVS